MRTLLTRAIPAVALISAAGVGGFLAYGLLATPNRPMPVPSPPPSQPSAGGGSGSGIAASLPAAPAGGHAAPARVIPDTLPDIAFMDRAGFKRRFSDWHGRPLLVNFWATWCEPCREEVPLLERLSREHTHDGLQVLGVAVDSRAAVLEYARREDIGYPLLIGEHRGLQLIRALGMQAVFPFSVFVDARGQIVTVKIGQLRADQAGLILDRLDELDQGRIDLATARREIADGIARLAVSRAQAALSPKL